MYYLIVDGIFGTRYRCHYRIPSILRNPYWGYWRVLSVLEQYCTTLYHEHVSALVTLNHYSPVSESVPARKGKKGLTNSDIPSRSNCSSFSCPFVAFVAVVVHSRVMKISNRDQTPPTGPPLARPATMPGNNMVAKDFIGSMETRGKPKNVTATLAAVSFKPTKPRKRRFPLFSLSPPLRHLFACLVYIVVTSLMIPSALRGGRNGNDGGHFASFAVFADAAPCTTTAQQSVTASQSSALNLSSLFDCEGGDFAVTWSGIVSVQASIKIGNGTTVSISGDYISDVTVADSSSSIGSRGSAVNNSGTSAAVAATRFGPIFVVQGGVLNLAGIAVREGGATVTIGLSGGGVFAEDANVTVTGCAFENSSAELYGGGIYANRSTLVVQDTAFRKCSAKDKIRTADDVDVDAKAAGGSIWVSDAQRLSLDTLWVMEVCD